jgi:hypothetical protein
VTNTLTFRLELVRRVKIVIVLRGTCAMPLITGCGRRLQVNTDLGLTAFVRVVGFPCVLGKKVHTRSPQQCRTRNFNMDLVIDILYTL